MAKSAVLEKIETSVLKPPAEKKHPWYAFFKGQFVPIEEAKVSIMTHAFNYGTGVFEGIRAYWQADEEQILVFRLKEHYDRMYRSCLLLFIRPQYSIDEMCDLTFELLRLEGYREDAYIRPIAYKADEKIGVRLHDISDEFCIFTTPMGRYIEAEEGARLGSSSWRRIDDNALPPRGKICGSYVNSALVKSEAIIHGYDEALVFNEDGHVSEGSAENVFIIRKGVLITPPVTDNILEGITRLSVMELAQNELGIEVVERPIDRTEVYTADEAFFTGTAAQVTAIVEVDHRTIGSGKLGPITSKLRNLYLDVVHGKVPKYRHWCTPVYPK